ncbi:MAG: acylneuraminate cytidylyltransferase family protein [Eubacteriales bacterium]|nr:acylneuraminate cytidylyltransferase family protein [Eubacteriales bacterium]
MGKVLAVITARSGSKGLKDKNIMPLNGKPLIGHTIDAARESGIFDTVHVSTDSELYAQISRDLGADVPFLRSAENSSDSASSWAVVREVIERYGNEGKVFDTCVLLQPTSPLRTSEDIRNSFALYCEKNAKSVTSVCEVEHPVQWCFELGEDRLMDSFVNSPYKKCRRQLLPKNYQLNGAIYITSCENILSEDFDFYGEKCYAYVMPHDRSLDIDDDVDLAIAELLMKRRAH